MADPNTANPLKFKTVDGRLTFLEHDDNFRNLLRDAATWEQRQYQKNEIVRDGDWMMRANKTTTARPTDGTNPDSADWDEYAYLEPEPRAILVAEAKPSGLYDGGELNIGPGANDIEVIAGAGAILDSYTDPIVRPSVVKLSWPQINELITGSPPTGPTIVWFTVRPVAGNPPGPVAGTLLGELVQYTTIPSPATIRDEVFIGYAVFNGASWQEVSSPTVVNNTAHTLAEFLTDVTGPTFNLDGGEVTEAAAFTLARAAGTVWELNRNWHVDKKDPHRESYNAQSPIQFRYTTSAFEVVSGLTPTIDAGSYENPLGVVTTVPGGANTATIQRLFIDPADNFWVLFGQNVYDSYSEAVAQIGVDTANTIIPDFLAETSLLLGFAVVEKAKSDWASEEARFVAPVEALGGGQAAPPLQVFVETSIGQQIAVNVFTHTTV